MSVQYTQKDCGYESPCWVWQLARQKPGKRTSGGYGLTKRQGKMRYAHRVFYEEQYGPIPPSLHLDHLRRNRSCVRPDHLEAVSPAENARRSQTTRLSLTDVQFIRSTASYGPLEAKRLAERFNVTRGHIQAIWRGDTWKSEAA